MTDERTQLHSLEYAPTAERGTSNRWAFFIAIGAGVVGGVATGLSGFGAALVAPVVGFVVGLLCSSVATSRRFAFGMLGCLVAVFASIGTAAVLIEFNRESWRDFPGFALAVALIIGVPGLMGATVGWVIRRIAGRS